MRIGIDIDGVLTDIERFQLDYGSKFFYEQFKREIIDPKGYDICDIFNTNIDLDDEFWNCYFIDYTVDEPVRSFAAEVIKKLKREKNKIYIITARGSFLADSNRNKEYEELKKMVTSWLSKNDIIYDKIIFSPEDKLEICLNNKIDIMIEDKPDNIYKISSKIPVICFNAGYNENCNGKNIIRCYSWYDIYAKINNLERP